ncbi:MAG: cytochrome c3 family protein [Chloroflexota bacterium]
MKAAIALVIIATGAILFPAIMAEASPGAPDIPHSLSGQEACLSCHGSQSTNPVPADHGPFPEGSCLGCHSPAASPSTGNTGPSPVSDCMSCHGRPGASMTLADGEKLSVFVDPAVMAASIHGDKLLCTDCHTTITGYPHPKMDIPGRRAYSIAQYELCKQCHFANYTKTLDSIHYKELSSGDLAAPLCTDCHGAHNVTLPSQPRTKISQTCAQCHQDIYQQYAGSVHGKALIEDNNYDVPVCTDCHQAHTIEDPMTATFRLNSVELCGHCHGDAALMQKYGISTNVVQTYLEDFHGRTVALVTKENKDIWVQEAVCTDCHGVHDIQAVDSPNSPVLKANLVTTCRKCHPDATANFPSAWLSHYEPSINHSPLVFLVRWFYRILIPFILLGLSVHVIVDLWRAVTNR